MKRIAAALLPVILLSPAAARAGCVDVRDLAAHVTDATGLGGLPDCLPIRRAAFSPQRGLMMSQAGAYDPATDSITLSPDLDLATPLGQSYLVHELVHMAQFRNATPARCPAEREAEAYAVQIGFLRDRGESREALVLQLASAALTTCTPVDPGY